MGRVRCTTTTRVVTREEGRALGRLARAFGECQDCNKLRPTETLCAVHQAQVPDYVVITYEDRSKDGSRSCCKPSAKD